MLDVRTGVAGTSDEQKLQFSKSQIINAMATTTKVDNI